MNRNFIISVIRPGPVSVGRVDIGSREKLMLYQLHDLRPQCTVAELSLHVDIPQTQIIPTLRMLMAHGYVIVRGDILDVYDTPQAGALTQKKAEVPYREDCMEMAEGLAPAIASAYHMNNFNKYALCYSLLQLVNKYSVDIEVLRRGCKWIAEHVTDPQFPVIQAPHCIVSKWGYICQYKKRWDEKNNRSKVIL